MDPGEHRRGARVRVAGGDAAVRHRATARAVPVPPSGHPRSQGSACRRRPTRRTLGQAPPWCRICRTGCSRSLPTRQPDPAVVGTHSHPGVTAACAATTEIHNTNTDAASPAANRRVRTIQPPVSQSIAARPRRSPPASAAPCRRQVYGCVACSGPCCWGFVSFIPRNCIGGVLAFESQSSGLAQGQARNRSCSGPT